MTPIRQAMALCGVLAVIGAAGMGLAAAASAEAEIRHAEQQMHDAYVKHDVSLFASLYAGDATFTYSSGRVEGKAGRVRRFTTPYPDLKDELQKLRIYGDVAVVNDRSDYTSRANGAHVALQITRVWLKRNGNWQVVAYQSTPIANLAPAK